MSTLPTKQKSSVVVVYTGEGKGKTSAGIGLVCRSLGHGDTVAFIQFIKAWKVSEHVFFADIAPIYGDKFLFHKGGRGFFDAGDMSAKGVSEEEHRASARDTFEKALECAASGAYQLVVCDEINNAVHDGLLTLADMERMIDEKHDSTSLCLTGRDFPIELSSKVDILSEMKQIRHHFDDGFIANEGIDY